MANEGATIVLDPAVSTTTGNNISGDPTVQPKSDPSILDPNPGPTTGAPDGDSQDPTKAAPKEDGKPATADPAKPAAAPEAWKFTDLKTPEGIAIDPAIGEEFTKTLQDKNLSEKDRAQKLVDLQSKVSSATVANSIAEFNKMAESWKEQTYAFLGNDADKQLGLAAKAREKFASPELMNILRDSGLGNHPEIVKFFISVGKAVSEDNFPVGKPSGGDKTFAEIMYPGTPKK